MVVVVVVVIVVVVVKYSALGPVWAGTRAQSGDRYGSGTLHSGQVLRVVCHCFPSRIDVPTFAARCLHIHNAARDPSSERWNYGRDTRLTPQKTDLQTESHPAEPLEWIGNFFDLYSAGALVSLSARAKTNFTQAAVTLLYLQASSGSEPQKRSWKVCATSCRIHCWAITLPFNAM
jgi:hypothetical protein